MAGWHRQGLSIIGICHSEPQAKNLKSFSKNLVLVLKRRNGGIEIPSIAQVSPQRVGATDSFPLIAYPVPRSESGTGLDTGVSG